jgi:hypothetical protein
MLQRSDANFQESARERLAHLFIRTTAETTRAAVKPRAALLRRACPSTPNPG